MPAYDPFAEDLKASSTWIPQDAGDTIAGIITAITPQENSYGEYDRISLRTRDGSEVAVNGFGGALKKRISDAKLGIGDMLKVQYNGWDEFARDGKPVKFKAFEIAVLRAEEIERRRAAAAGEPERPAKPTVDDSDLPPY